MAEQIETALYVVATPIGNLSDITLRALEVLKGVDVIACEDTRITSRLCEKYDIKTRLVSYHKFCESSRSEMFLDYLRQGKSIALVSDAGTPLISDPGEILVNQVKKEGFKVIPIVGANAIIALLSAVPRGSEDFKFIGFLPRVKGQISDMFLKNKYENLVFYQSPNRIVETLEVLVEVRPETLVSLGRELTKKFEEIKTDTALEILQYYRQKPPKGEIVCMVYADKFCTEDARISEKALVLKGLNICDKDIASILCSLYELPKNKVKEVLYNLKG